jgi:hypothetical protein
LVLEKQDLKEICLSVLVIGQSLLKETAALTREAGIPLLKRDDNVDQPNQFGSP